MQKISIDSEWVINPAMQGNRRLEHDCSNFRSYWYHTVSDVLATAYCSYCNIYCPKETIKKFLFIEKDL